MYIVLIITLLTKRHVDQDIKHISIFEATRAKVEPSAHLHVFAFAAERGGFGKTKLQLADSFFSLPAPEVVRVNRSFKVEIAIACCRCFSHVEMHLHSYTTA